MSEIICTCVLDRSRMGSGQGGHYTPIAKLCPLHAVGPRAVQLLRDMPTVHASSREYEALQAWQTKVLDLLSDLGICTCLPCRVCYNGRFICARCGECARHSAHAPGCKGCSA
jgi:hypothetical protein